MPFTLYDFFTHYYDQRILRLNHTLTDFDPQVMWSRSDFEGNLKALAADGMLSFSGGGAIKSFGNVDMDLSELPPAEAADHVSAKLASGVSFMLSFEKVSPRYRPMK